MENNETAEKSRNVLVLFQESLLERIDDYRYANRIPSRSEAMRILIESGLEGTKKPPASAKPVPARKRKSGD